jgi:hypothetical protein
MSETTLIKKLYINDVTDESKDIAGKINQSDLSTALQLLLDTNKVKVTTNDTTPDYLFNKLIEGSGITLTETTDGGDESVTIATDGKLKVSANDTTAAYLEDKIVGDSYISVSTLNDAGDEDVKLTFNTGVLMGNHIGWVLDTIAESVIRADETEFDAETSKLRPGTGAQQNILFREDVATAGSMGVLVNIGSSNTMSTGQWTAVSGLLFEYVAENNNWFNIKNGGTAPNTRFKPINTGCAGDLKFLSRALFCYDNVLDVWVLKSCTKAKWARTDAIGIINANEAVDVCLSLPQIGTYKFDIYLTVDETNTDTSPANTESAQILTVESLVVDTSPTYTPEVLTSSVWQNHSLQGSGLISITDATLATRIVSITVTLPNGDVQAVTGGYIHLTYLGDLIID